jgi:hypothetical protein
MAKTATEELETLRQEAAAEKAKARDATVAAQTATERANGEARNNLVEAHATENTRQIKKAEDAYHQALADADAAAIRAEGAERRAARAEQAVVNFEAGRNDDLFRDLEPAAVKARDDMASAFDAVFLAAQNWNDVASRASQLVAASGKSTSRENGPSENPYGSAIHQLRQAVANGAEVPLPLPHWQKVKFLAQQEQEAMARAEREGDKAAA